MKATAMIHGQGDPADGSRILVTINHRHADAFLQALQKFNVAPSKASSATHDPTIAFWVPFDEHEVTRRQAIEALLSMLRTSSISAAIAAR